MFGLTTLRLSAPWLGARSLQHPCTLRVLAGGADAGGGIPSRAEPGGVLLSGAGGGHLHHAA
eukprot:4989779-Pyramimonas_sp.AAC.1